MSEELMQDMSKLLKEEGSFVKELTDVAVQAASFHARLESIKKAMETDKQYDSVQADALARKAADKYESELRQRMRMQN